MRASFPKMARVSFYPRFGKVDMAMLTPTPRSPLQSMVPSRVSVCVSVIVADPTVALSCVVDDKIVQAFSLDYSTRNKLCTRARC